LFAGCVNQETPTELPTIGAFQVDDVEIEAGGEALLSWDVSDVDEITITDEEGIVVFAGGQLVGEVSVTPGTTTTYTLTARNGARTVTATVTVTVLPPPDPAVESVTIDSGPFGLLVGEATTLTATVVVTGGAPQTVTWSSDDATVATVDPSTGEVTGVAVGTAIVTATSTDDPSKSDDVQVTVTPSAQVLEVDIDQGDLLLAVGESSPPFTATVTVTGDAPQTVTWSSDDPTIASVDPNSGVVTALAEGTATITATSTDDPSESDDVQVIVTAAAEVISVTIDQGDQALEVGDAVTLTATVQVTGGAPQTVTWSSDDATVASVDPNSGEVTANADGTATITATSTEDPGEIDSVEVTVDPAQEVLSVTIDQGDQALEVGDAVTLTATVQVTGGAPQTVTWSSDDATVASVDPNSGEVTANADGTATITATSTFDGAQSDDVEVTVTLPPAPTISSFDAEVVAESQLELNWSATGVETFEVFAVLDSDPNDAIQIASGATATSATVDIPASDRQLLRLVVSNPGGDATDEVTPVNVVTETGDYDPYDPDGPEPAGAYWPEPEVEGTLRSVLANAAAGSTIGFASDISTVALYGVDLEDVAGVTADAHLIFRDDVTVSAPPSGVTLQGGSGWEPGDPGDAFTYRSRMIYVDANATVTLENLTITGGTFIFNGGGIANAGDLTLIGSEVSGNRAWGRGGGINNFDNASLTLQDSVVSGNRAVTENSEDPATFDIRGRGSLVDVGAPAGGFGGGIANDVGGSVTIIDSTIENNEARRDGGGLYNLGDADLDGSDVQNNTADVNVYEPTSGTESWGGGIYTAGVLTMNGGDILDNTAGNQGGGVLYFEGSVSASLDTVLIQGNLAGTSGDTGYGGGIMHRYYDGDQANLTLTDVTYGTGNTPLPNLYDSPEGAAPIIVTPGGLPGVAPSGLEADDRN
jgi:uncharacterized protein YjdB